MAAESAPPDPTSSAPPSGGSATTLFVRLTGMLRTMRPHQWVKNLFVLAPVVFAKHLAHPSIIKSALGAFGVFCLLAGAIYTLNDLVDVEADRHHPVKRKRPIASGTVPPALAKVMVVGLLVVALGGASLGPPKFLAVAVAYLVLQIAYSFKLKQYPWIDVLCIASGFVLRVLAGGYAIKTPVSGYMLACTLLLALFLGFGKRRHEIAGANPEKQRKALERYSQRSLFWALATTGFATVATYTAYTLDPHTQQFFRSDWLWLTALHPLLGVLRFLQIVHGRPQAESPTQEILRDTPFVLNVIIWIVEVVVILYRLRPT